MTAPRGAGLRAAAAVCAAATVLTISASETLAQHQAVPRPPAAPAHVVSRPYYPVYYPYGGYYFPYGAYVGFGWGWYYGAPYFYQPFPPPYYGGYYGGVRGSLRLQVTPRDTEVFIDGHFAGTADDYDGTFQRLYVEPGEHTVELFHPQHQTVSQNVYVQPDKTFTMKLNMPQLAPADPAPTRPTPSQPAPNQSAQDAPRRPRPSQPGSLGAGSEFGAVSLRVQPRDAEILIDGERWDGAADGSRLVIELAPGVHQVEVRKDGFRTYHSDVTVRRGQTTTVNIGLAQN